MASATDFAAPPGPANQWSAPSFESELSKLALTASEEAAVRALRDAACDDSLYDGHLEWDRRAAQGIAKRGTRALDKWLGLDADGTQHVRGLRIFIDPPPAAMADAHTADALRRFLRIVRASNGKRPRTARTAPLLLLLRTRRPHHCMRHAHIPTIAASPESIVCSLMSDFSLLVAARHLSMCQGVRL